MTCLAHDVWEHPGRNLNLVVMVRGYERNPVVAQHKHPCPEHRTKASQRGQNLLFVENDPATRTSKIAAAPEDELPDIKMSSASSNTPRISSGERISTIVSSIFEHKRLPEFIFLWVVISATLFYRWQFDPDNTFTKDDDLSDKIAWLVVFILLVSGFGIFWIMPIVVSGAVALLYVLEMLYIGFFAFREFLVSKRACSCKSRAMNLKR
ncbi:hypothetical protein BT63DRAFT_410329 [Microthyrium microscopicum]|uniref:Uncharacterized protein n=1 Tax=Microthyrium microscopicum TaxID=703497 RepID=A0A6A6UQD7_9PEZI|nr:hypothetical protein BT63DRAFT_410329 [Microthyrium microscopicum]